MNICSSSKKKKSIHVFNSRGLLKEILGGYYLFHYPVYFHVSIKTKEDSVMLCTCSEVFRAFWIKPVSFDRFQGLSTSSDMKPAHHTLFRDQVSTLVEWFASWNECEQTIALYTLLKRISTIQARFLSLILEHTFREDSFEVQVMQRRANDKGKNLCLARGWNCFVYFCWIC